MKEKMESILESFVKSEINVTESRIAAIRQFADTLKAELLEYTKNLPTTPDEREQLSLVLKLFRSMIATYDEELKLLMGKREKMLEHLLQIRSIAIHLKPFSGNIYIN